MDISPEYILMCRKAMKYIGVPKSFLSPYIDTVNNSIMTIPYLKKCIPLYTQDQLQNIIWKSLGTYCSNKLNSLTWGVWNFYNTIDDLDSMEQVWLAFTMHDLYQRKWDGTDWIEV
ncbi:MAG TPA: hypothetical protein VMX17_11550 [Candidatus Glassbacteria bacterium]|nr:hypothetical protein [Candidatus Glassbacteria bacterium]